MRIRFILIAMIQPNITYSIPHLERSPPIAGPMRKANPNAAPIIPMFFVLDSRVDISDIYACATQSHAPPRPEMNLAMRNTTNRKPIFSEIIPCDKDSQRMI